MEEIVRGYVLVSWTHGGLPVNAPRHLYRLVPGEKPPLEIYFDSLSSTVSQVDVGVDDNDVLTPLAGQFAATLTEVDSDPRFDLSDWAHGWWWEEVGLEVLDLVDGGLVALLSRESLVTGCLRMGSLELLLSRDLRLAGVRLALAPQQLELVRFVLGQG